ncbi:MAG: hypothetical protein WCJ33_01745 [Pseudomonadota bacterium]
MMSNKNVWTQKDILSFASFVQEFSKLMVFKAANGQDPNGNCKIAADACKATLAGLKEFCETQDQEKLETLISDYNQKISAAIEEISNDELAVIYQSRFKTCIKF